MSTSTYIKFYENEYRTIELIVRDMCEEDFNVDTATSHIESVVNEVSTGIVMEETVCMVIGNKVRTIVPTSVSNTKGMYWVIWTVRKSGMEYKHKTILNIEELS
jgi:hypothetical protein